MKKIVILSVKIAGSLAIFGLLFWLALRGKENRETFFDMLALLKQRLTQPGPWGLLAGGLGLVLTIVVLTMIRWCLLVRAVGIPLSMRDALRIGFLGYLFNLAPLGIVGGDLVKALMLSREHPGNRAKALASVIVDRILGLYVLFLVASASVLLCSFWNLPDFYVRLARNAVLAVTAVSTAGIVVLMIPGVLESRWVTSLTRSRKVGPAIDSLLVALRIYRANKLALLLGCLLTVPVHVLNTGSVLTISWGLGFTDIPWMSYFSIYSVSGILSTIPLPAGPMEGAMQFVYVTAATGWVEITKAAHQGLILALAYRLATLLVAPIGMAYYFLGGRREVAEVMHDEEESGVVERT